MNRIIFFFAIAIFSIFLGSQITEGFLLIPYWKTLSNTGFYEYYSQFGPIIARFYTFLTIAAASISIGVSVYCFYKKSYALKYSIVSSFFACAFIALFLFYFKDTNQQFYNSTFSDIQLKSVFKVYGNWHWFRVLLEFLSLAFLILSVSNISQQAIHKN